MSPVINNQQEIKKSTTTSLPVSPVIQNNEMKQKGKKIEIEYSEIIEDEYTTVETILKDQQKNNLTKTKTYEKDLNLTFDEILTEDDENFFTDDIQNQKKSIIRNHDQQIKIIFELEDVQFKNDDEVFLKNHNGFYLNLTSRNKLSTKLGKHSDGLFHIKGIKKKKFFFF